MNCITIEIPKTCFTSQPDSIVIHLDEELFRSYLFRANPSGPPKPAPQERGQQPSSISVHKLFEERASELERSGKIRTAETYRSTLSNFSKFRPQELEFAELTKETIEDYEQWMLDQGLSRNTSSFYLRHLRAVYKMAVERGVISDEPIFEKVFTGMDKTRKRALPLKWIKTILSMPPDKEREDFALDMFRFSILTRGMSFVDMCFLKQTDIRNGVLSYRRKKTGQLIRIRWEHQMQAIVDKHKQQCDGYLLPLVKKNGEAEYQQYKRVQHTLNNRLKSIGRKLGIPDPLTMYVARHSWATIAKQMNVPLPVICDSMGHHSERTTQIYLAQIDADIIDETNSSIINYIESLRN